MSLTYRPTRSTDLESCLAIAGDREAYKAVEVEAVLSFWDSLLESKVAPSRVVEDRARPFGRQILGFGLSVFVTEEFKQELKASPWPHVGRQAFLRWRNGRRTILTREEIARGNSEGGLNLFVMACGMAPRPPGDGDGDGEASLRVRSRMLEACIECHGGYVIKEFMQEMFGPEERASALGMGLKLVRDFPGASAGAARGDAVPSALMGLQRESCAFPNPFWGFFYPPRPRFQFTGVEKDVLEAALCHGTDEEISKSLDISIWTIKKRWQKVYEKVERAIPNLLQPAQGEESAPVDSFSGQRRRYLLDYLRQSPEEIRPTVEASRARSLGRR
jgi:hypothetical protein